LIPEVVLSVLNGLVSINDDFFYILLGVFVRCSITNFLALVHCLIDEVKITHKVNFTSITRFVYWVEQKLITLNLSV